MVPEDFNYVNLAGAALQAHTCDGRTESAAFLAWFLENILRLNDVEAADAICDGPSDRGIDAVYVDHDNNEIIVLQAKVRQNDARTVGDQPIRDFAGSIAQFSTPEQVSAAIAEMPGSEISKLMERMKVEDRLREGYALRGWFVTNSTVDENGVRAAQATVISVYDRSAIAGRYVEIDAPDVVEGTVPIRLSPTPTTSRVLPVARVKLGVSGSGDIASDSEQGPEGVERVESPVEAEGELVEVGLEVLVAHAVMNATQPRLQVGEDEMNDRQILLSDLGVASLGDGEVFVAALGEAGIAGPIVGDDRRTRSNGALDKAAERFRAAVWHDSESDTSGVATALPLIELGSRLALSHFNGAGDKKLVVNAPALAARAAADPGFVDFDMVAGLAADAVLIRPNHTSAELVEDLKGGFVTGKPDLALELCGRHAGRLAGNQIGRPEPYAQRRMGALHDRPRRQPGVAAALSTAQDAGPAGEAERLCRRLAMGADEPVTPPRLLQVGGTGRVIREKSLKLGKRPRKRKVFALRNIHPRFVRLPSHSTPHPTYSGCG